MNILLIIGIVIFLILIVFWKSIRAFFEGWEKIDEKDVPKWVGKAYFKWERRLPTHPYNMTKHFAGNTFVYRVRHGMGMQGEAPIIAWYVKKK